MTDKARAMYNVLIATSVRFHCRYVMKQKNEEKTNEYSNWKDVLSGWSEGKGRRELEAIHIFDVINLLSCHWRRQQIVLAVIREILMQSSIKLY